MHKLLRPCVTGAIVVVTACSQGSPGPSGPQGVQGPAGTAVSVIEAEAASGAGAIVDDPSASDGQARFGAAAGTAGGVAEITASALGRPLGKSLTRASFRLKVTNNASTQALATVGCAAIRRSGSGFEAAGTASARTIHPADFVQGEWGTVSVLCDFRPDDVDQRATVDGFVTGITDVSVDTLTLYPQAPCDVEMAPVGDGRCIDRSRRTETAYGSSILTCADEGKRLCTFSEVVTAARRGAISEDGADLRYADIMFYSPNGRSYLPAGGGAANSLNLPGGLPITTTFGPFGSPAPFRCCR
jgi:hypothetical protein